MNTQQNTKELMIYTYKINNSQVKVLSLGNNFWMSTKEIAKLYDTRPNIIKKIINNIYKDNECCQEQTQILFYEAVTKEKHVIRRAIPYYNIDIIVSIGYRLNTRIATQFRKWLTSKLKEYPSQSKELCVHFDTEEHQIPLEQFEQTLISYKNIAKDFAENIFDIKSGLKIYVLPPKNGGFEVFLKIFMENPAISALSVALTYDIVKGLVKGLTKNENSEKFKDGFTPELGAEVFGETIKGFMSETASEIEILEAKINEEYKPTKPINLDISKKQKADFYESCIREKGIKGIGFSQEHNFPLKRCDFVGRATPPKIKSLPNKTELKELIIVKSVNTDEKLQWEFKDANTNEAFSASIEDTEFNAMILNGQCPLKKKAAPDKIIALVEFHKKLENGKERKDAFFVKDVYQFNRRKIKDRPKGLRINKPKIEKPKYVQLDIFNSSTKKNNNME